MTKELSNPNDFPFIFTPLTGTELIPGKQGSNSRVAITMENIGDYVLGPHALTLTSFSSPITSNTQIMTAGPDQAYRLDMFSLSSYINTQLPLTSTGLVNITVSFNGIKNIDVAIASSTEADAVSINNKAVTPASLVNYKNQINSLLTRVTALETPVIWAMNFSNPNSSGYITAVLM